MNQLVIKVRLARTFHPCEVHQKFCYRIIEIICVLSLVDWCVLMRVYKHCCDVTVLGDF